MFSNCHGSVKENKTKKKKNIKPAFVVLSRASEMAQWLAFKPGDIGSIPGTYTLKV